MNNDFIHDITKALNSITKSKNAEEWEIDIDENIDDFVINHIYVCGAVMNWKSQPPI